MVRTDNRILAISPLLLAFGVLLLLRANAAEPTAWIGRSNTNARPLLDYFARYEPEYGTTLGLENFDEQVKDLKPDVYQRSRADGERVLQGLLAEAKVEIDPKIHEDLEIMITALTNKLESARLNYELMLPYYNVPEDVFEGLRSLLDLRNSSARQAKAITRLKRYAGLESGYEPITQLAEARLSERFENQHLIGPYIEEVNQGLNNTEQFITGIADLFKTAKLTGWEEAQEKLAEQLRSYAVWVKKEIVHRARQTNVLPEAIYADNLKTFGVNLDPRTLIERASFEFIEMRDEMQVLADQVARQEKFPSSDYRNVIRELKKRQVPADAILPFYQRRLQEIEKLVREHDIVTLPPRPAGIRLASEAESAAVPAPHFLPPRLLGNTGEYGEFVLPLGNPNSKSGIVQDDFTNEAFSWTVTAHEARPGHDLQYSAMIETGVSIPRAVFAFNSANVEGWALYMEAVMKPYEPLDGQLLALDARMFRAARAFLDPMLHLGLLKPDQAKDFLTQEVVLSEPFATEEVDRYTFKEPGQATSYFYGYMKLRELRARTELALRGKFNQKAFHDFLLRQGLLPPELLEKAVANEFIPQYQ
jgi:uncharacterized protein (DUF885 family)